MNNKCGLATLSFAALLLVSASYAETAATSGPGSDAMEAPTGVEFRQVNRCAQPPVRGVPGVRPPEIDGIVFVPEAFDATNDDAVRKALVFGAARVKEICGYVETFVKIGMYPMPAKEQGGTFYYAPLADGRLSYDSAAGHFTLVGPSDYTNYESERVLRRAPLAAFYKKTGVQEVVVDIRELETNPFVYEGKVVAVKARFDAMISRSEAFFGDNSLLAIGVPTTRFRSPGGEVVLAGLVKGRLKYTMPSGQSILITQLTFVDAYESAVKLEDLRPALKGWTITSTGLMNGVR